MSKKPSAALLEKAASERILIIDGAMGTMIQQHKPAKRPIAACALRIWHATSKATTNCLSLTQPDIIEEIHDQYFAPAPISTETNTFGAQRHLPGRLRHGSIVL